MTVDFDSLEDRAVTVRDRDTTEQVRVPIDRLVAELDAGSTSLSRAPCGRRAPPSLAPTDAR